MMSFWLKGATKPTGTDVLSMGRYSGEATQFVKETSYAGMKRQDVIDLNLRTVEELGRISTGTFTVA